MGIYGIDDPLTAPRLSPRAPKEFDGRISTTDWIRMPAP
jgi:hypothetical protein